MAKMHTQKILFEQHRPAGKPLVIIPARGGSKGIPNKNICNLGGLPLIAYSIFAALAADNLGRVVLSTDDEKIAEVGRSLGAEVPFLRSAKNATDEATIGPAIEEVLSYYTNLEGCHLSYMVLYPTSPFRTPELLNFMAQKLSEGFHKISTVFPIAMPDTAYRLDGDRLSATGIMSPSHRAVRQCGSISGESKTVLVNNTYFHELTNPIELIDIDTRADLRQAEFVMDNGLYEFNVPELDVAR